MLSIQTIRENSHKVISRLKIKNFDARETVDRIIDLDRKKRNLLNKIENLQSDLNKKSKEIGQLYKSGRNDQANDLKKITGTWKENIKTMQQDLGSIHKDLNALILQLPNIPHESVPPGKDSDNNKLIRSGGKMPELTDGSLPHWELIKKYGIIDFRLGNKLTAAGFPVYKNSGAKLQRALINFFLNENIRAGYEEMIPPLMVNEDSAFATGQLPDKEGMMYSVSPDNLFLIPTAEVPLTNVYRDTILSRADLPVKITAYTPCFRREAGSWGKEVRGLNRLHQFDKVEIVQIEDPGKSYACLEEMARHIEGLIRKLRLPYRIMQLCGGDIGFTSSLTYDFEVYAAAQKKWLEVSSVSNFEDFQANRLKLRFRDEKTKKTRLLHTLNGSALALPRIVTALLENNQTPGGIMMPEVLHKYTGFDMIS